MSKIYEDEKSNWNDSRLIDIKTLKQLDQDLINPTKKTNKNELPGNPSTDGEDPYNDGGCPR